MKSIKKWLHHEIQIFIENVLWLLYSACFVKVFEDDIEKWYWVWHASNITPTCSKNKEICKNVMSIQALHWITLLGRILFMMQGDIFPYIIMLPREEILDLFAIWHEKISQKKPFKVFEYLWIVHDTFCVYFTMTLDKRGCKWF